MLYFHSLLPNRWSLRAFLFIILLSLTACESFSGSVAPTASHEEVAIEIAKQELPSQGILQQRPDGFVYLKVSNEYVHRLFPLVQETGFEIPNAIKRHTQVGAHISVFFKDEGRRLDHIDEIGRVYTFEPKRIRIIRSHRKEYIILEVKAPELERLRQQYGLSPKLVGHEFHITLAEKDLHRFKRH